MSRVYVIYTLDSIAQVLKRTGIGLHILIVTSDTYGAKHHVTYHKINYKLLPDVVCYTSYYVVNKNVVSFAK